MKYFLLLLLPMLVGCFKSPYPIEFYTPSNVYYIQDSRVTDEVSGIDTTFNSFRAAVKYVSVLVTNEATSQYKFMEQLEWELSNNLYIEVINDDLQVVDECNNLSIQCNMVDTLGVNHKLFYIED